MNILSKMADQRFGLFLSTAALIILSNCVLYDTALASSSALELVSTHFIGNTSGVFNPGGTFGLTATMTAINQTALNSSATLASADSCVSITQGSAAYGSIPVSQNVSNSTSPFQFSISSLCVPGHLINLTLTMTASGYTSSPIIIPLLVSVPSVPVIAPPYTCVINYYVSKNGSNSNNGTSAGSAWLTIGHAISAVQALGGTHGGVCVNVEPGTYNEFNYATGLSGTGDSPNGYLVFRSMMPHGATIQMPAADASNASDNDFRFDHEHFIVIDGFNLVGQVVPGSVESGVVSNSYGAPGDHMKIINNILANHGGAGVGAVHTDYLTVEGNIVFGNANTSSYEVSGISDWQAVASDKAAGFHNIIRNNIIFNNAEVSDGHVTHSDGNGIIIDDFRNTQNGSTYGAYSPQTLIENNLVFGNGGAGIHVFLSDHVTVLNNTTRGNELDPIGLGTWRGEINVVNGANNTFVNNIAVARQTANTWNAPNVSLMDNSTNGSNTNNIWHNNLSFNGTAGQGSILISGSGSTITSAQGNILGQDTKFVDTSLNDFNLQPGSPAITGGTNVYGFPSIDIAGITRSSSALDIGAYKYSSISYPLTVAYSGNGFGMIFGSTATSNNLINCGVNAGANLCSVAITPGTEVISKATAASGSAFSGWTVTGSPVGTCIGTTSPCIVTVTAATNVKANFTPQTFALTSSAAPGGTIYPSGTIQVYYGASQTYSVTPFLGYIPSLKIDGTAVVLTNNAYTLNDVTSSHTITAGFSPQIKETITSNAQPGGMISPSGTVSANFGTTQTYTVYPVAGYIPILKVDGTTVALTDNTYILSNITAAHNITASFSMAPKPVLASSAAPGGTVNPAGTISVNYGASQTYTVTPFSGYTPILKVDGIAVALTKNSYVLSNITSSHTITVSFSL